MVTITPEICTHGMRCGTCLQVNAIGKFRAIGTVREGNLKPVYIGMRCPNCDSDKNYFKQDFKFSWRD